MSTARYDPYTWRLEQLQQSTHAHAGGTTEQTATLTAELLIAEAQELAHGRRHLTIEHGALNDIVELDQRDLLLAAIDQITVTSPWRRVTITDHYITVTVGGAGATTVLEAVARNTVLCSPGGWRLVASARPTSP